MNNGCMATIIIEQIIISTDISDNNVFYIYLPNITGRIKK